MFVPPIMAAAGDKASEVSWYREMLPDFLWIALMLGRRSDWRAVYSAMDVVDRFVPEGDRFADGRLTGFALVPEDARPAARQALRRETPHALPSSFGHLLALYPSCPARWLYGDWLVERDLDREQGLTLARQLTDDHTDKSGVAATRLRMAAFSRRVTHGKMSHDGSGVFKLIPHYPNRLGESEQRMVESTMRAMWGATFGLEADSYPDLLQWPQDFWSRNRELTSCTFRRQRKEMDMPEEDGPLDTEPLLVSEYVTVLRTMDALGDGLQDAQMGLVSQPQEDPGTEVLLGLASRLYRLLYVLLERPSAWSPQTIGLHVRPIVDARILVTWLKARNDPAIFAAYREHGLGRLKLMRDHVEGHLGDDAGEVDKQLLEHLNKRVNLERDELFQPVNIGAFSKLTPREMAIECGLKEVYDLTYAPLSSDNHGEWPAVREQDTVMCKEPLHGRHRVGAFDSPDRMLQPGIVESPLTHARAGIERVFHGTPGQAAVGEGFDAVAAAIDDAVHSKD